MASGYARVQGAGSDKSHLADHRRVPAGLARLSLIVGLIRLRPEAFGPHRAEQAAEVADPLGGCPRTAQGRSDRVKVVVHHIARWLWGEEANATGEN